MIYKCIFCNNELEQIYRNHHLFIGDSFITYICYNCQYKNEYEEYLTKVIVDCNLNNKIIGYQVECPDLCVRFWFDAMNATKITQLVAITLNGEFDDSEKIIHLSYIEYEDLKNLLIKEKIDLLKFYN
jgi:hypothetical protein